MGAPSTSGDVLRLPHFLGIGAQRSGTTWLYHNLRQVPEVWLPPVKELHYFDRFDPGFYKNVPSAQKRFHPHVRARLRRNANNLAKLLPRLAEELAYEGLSLPRWALLYHFGKPSDAWYRSLFASAARRGRVTGEITPGYCLLSRESVARIHDMNPEMKIIFILRDPVERTWSQAVKRLARDRGRAVSDIPDDEFHAFFATERIGARADYVESLSRWEAYFPRENIHVEFFESVVEEPAALLLRVTAFLGVRPPPANRAAMEERRNTAAADAPALPPHFHSEIARMVAPHLDRLAERFPERAAMWRARHAEFMQP